MPLGSFTNIQVQVKHLMPDETESSGGLLEVSIGVETAGITMEFAELEFPPTILCPWRVQLLFFQRYAIIKLVKIPSSLISPQFSVALPRIKNKGLNLIVRMEGTIMAIF